MKKLVLIFILSLNLGFSVLLYGTNINVNVNDEINNWKIEIKSSATVSHEYEWYRTWGGGLSDIGGNVAVDSSDNVFIGGATESFGAGGADIVLLKYDNSGIFQWQRIWGGNHYDSGNDIAVDSLDNIYLVGTTNSYTAGGSDVILIKYDNSGVLQWNVTWGGSEDDEGLGITIDSLNNVYITGDTDTYSNKLLAKYDSSGVLQWSKTNSELAGIGKELALDSLGNIYLVGETYYGEGLTDVLLEKYNSAGVIQWNKTWGGSNWDYGWDVDVDSANNVYVSGRTRSFGVGDSDMLLIKYDSTGTQLWNRTWGGVSTDLGVRITIDSLDNVYFAGTTVGFGAGLFDMTLVKYNAFGEQLWYRTWGGSSSDYGVGVILDSSENIFIGGATGSFGAGIEDFALVKYSKIPEITINSPNQNDLYGHSAPTFSIYILEPNLHSTWYTLDDGVNIPFSGLTGIINQIEWDKETSGGVTIQFYANNTLGKEGSAEVTVLKDIENPEILIYSPNVDEEFGSIAPSYDLVINEPNLDSIWYTIDGGVNNYTITLLSGDINQSAWDAAVYGAINIRFYAEDLVGNIDYNEVNIKKIKETPAIPGYELFVLISLIGIITIIYLRKNAKIIK